MLFGGDGNDTLVAGSGFDVLLGGAGNDQLSAQDDHDVLIGGTGKDTLEGGKGSSLLIGSTTDHDANLDALRAILAEWALGAPVADRIAHLTGDTPGGLNGAYMLTHDIIRPGGTVHDDGVQDKLKGSSAIDWFFMFDFDKLNLSGPDVINHT